MGKTNYLELAKECLEVYPCRVDVYVNPNYYVPKGYFSEHIGTFKPNEVTELAKALEEVSNKVFSETGYYISGLDWLDILPEDESLFHKKLAKDRS